MSADLYQQAACLLRLVRNLDESLCSRPSDPFGPARAERAWAQLLPALIAIGNALPAESSPLADWIRELGWVAKRFNELVQKHGMRELLWRYMNPGAGFARLVDSGDRLMREFQPRPADPFAFVEPPPATAAPSIPNETPTGAHPEPPALPPPQPLPEPALAALLRVYTNGVADERLRQAAQILTDDTLTAHEKLTRIDGLIRFPPTASAEQLGAMLGVSKQAVMKTAWWRKNRRGMTDEEIERRQARLTDRGRKYERPRAEEDDDER